MTFQPVPDVIQVAIHGVLLGDLDITNVYHLRLVGTALDQSGTDAISNEMAGWYNDIKGQFTNGMQWRECVVTDLRTLGAPQFLSTTGFPVTGTDASGNLPNEVAALVQWHTALRGPWYRGRTFLSGIGMASSAGNTMTPGCQGNLAGAAVDFLADFTALGLPLVTVSRIFEGNQRPVGVSTPITGVTVAAEFKSQRERRPSN